jgi:PAS domain S-box-containing protein
MSEIARVRERLAGLSDPLGFVTELFVNAPFGIEVFSRDGHVLVTNPAIVTIFGADPPPGYCVFDDPTAAREGLDVLIRRAFAGEVVELPTVWYDASELVPASGRRRAITPSFFPLRGESRDVEFVAAIFRDDTDRERAVAAGRESEVRLREIIDLLPAFVTAQSESSRFILANREVAAFYGKTPGEMEGLTYEEVMGEAEPEVRADLRRLLLEPGAPPILRGVPSTLPGTNLVLDIYSRTFTQSNGEPAVLTVGLDVSERVRAETALRLSEARYRAQFELAPEAISTVDLDTRRYVEANEQALRLYGYSREELFRLTPAEVSPPFQPDGRPSSEAAAGYIQEAMAGGSPRFEWVHRNKAGRDIPVEIRLKMMPGNSPEERLCRASIVDISERKEAEALKVRSVELELDNRRIQQANRLKTEFLANMSHELRTPLNAIIGFAELLHDGAVEPTAPQHREFLGDILSSGRHLLQLINDVLDLAKVEAGKLEFRPESASLDRLVNEVAALLRTQIADRRVEIRFETDVTIDAVRLDPARFKQVLVNYLSNAIKFTGEGGVIVVRTLPVDDDPRFFRLEVEDNGVGIAPTDLGRLFVEFQQLDAGSTKRHGGTGLGLALTRRLVEAQGGSVGVKSEPGVGSTFHAVLPRHAVGGNAWQAPHATLRPGARTVLVVEDDARDRALLEESLRAEGYLVESAETVAEATAFIARRRYDAVILDMLLPDGTGLALINALRVDRALAVPVIVVTVVADARAVVGAQVDEVLPKPIDMTVVHAALRRAGVMPDRRGGILVIDDDERNLRLMEAALTQLGHHPITRRTAAAGLEAAERLAPRAVIVDLFMPGLDGFAFLDRLRSMPGHGDTLALVWTVRDLSPEERTRLGRAAQGCLPKGEATDRSLMDELEAKLGVSVGKGE